MLNVYISEDQKVFFNGDDEVLEVVIGQDISNIDISGTRATLDNVAKFYIDAMANKSIDNCAKYVKLKEKHIAAFSK